MARSLLDFAYQLTQAGEPFVLATVVWCERPTSAKPGAQAIIQSNGQVTGWIGGSCFACCELSGSVALAVSIPVQENWLGLEPVAYNSCGRCPAFCSVRARQARGFYKPVLDQWRRVSTLHFA